MNPKISPKFKLNLLDKIEKRIWDCFQSYKKVKTYLIQWQKDEPWDDVFFTIINKNDSEDIDLTQTLANIDDETIMKIAVDLEISTPDFIPSVAEIENTFKTNYHTAQQTFQKALTQSYDNPDSAVALANSALESIVKHILSDSRFKDFDRNKTLYKLTIDLLKEFKLFPPKELPTPIRNISQSLLKAVQSIENLRSNNTDSHGKLDDDYVIHDSLYAFFTINAVTTVGLFLISFYEKKYQSACSENDADTAESMTDDIPF